MLKIPTKIAELLFLTSLLVMGSIALPAQAKDDDAVFTHAITIKVDGKKYHLAGAPDGPNGATDIPGHYWSVVDKTHLVGKHFNTGPFGAPQWWSTDADDGALLYSVAAVIDTWSERKALNYYNQGFNHYHELVTVKDGTLHPTKVIWLRHAAVGDFNLDGGPHPELGHVVAPGVDFRFIANWKMPYDGGS